MLIAPALLVRVAGLAVEFNDHSVSPIADVAMDRAPAL
jgi:hypothetical protein